MTDELYTDLAWLPRPPSDFRRRCRELEQAERLGVAVRSLAGYALDENQLRQLAAALGRLRAAGRTLSPLVPFKLGLLGNATLEPVVPVLVATAARHGIALECIQADFAQTVQEALSADSVLNRAKPDGVLIALDFRGLPLGPGLHTQESARAAIDDAVAFVATLRTGFRTNSGAISLVQTLAPPPESLFGSFERAVPGTPRHLSEGFNAALLASVGGSADVVLDVASLAETVGLANWHSPTQWNMAKLGFDARFLPLYAEHVCRILGALRGKSRRCLILDLDNTVWGGVVGDDGLEGIVIGQGDATGEAYLDVQRTALALRERGIVLAVSSKNDDRIARSVFIAHPEMLLRENHIAVFQANWNDKATNIAAIAAELSLGLDSMVFLDDNPAERALIRETLPEVAVPELPEDPALYARTLAAAGYFEAVNFSEEDRQRAEFYQLNARRVALRGQVADLDAYLSSLDMRIGFRPFDAAARSRVTQLINKSNQYNLTTRRYTELEIAGLERGSSAFTLQVRLSDAFGDNGIISVVICRALPNAVWDIDTWLMSCRVLGRRVEQAVLHELVRHARAQGIRRLVGAYRPTERNGLVADHYSKLQFRLLAQEPDGGSTWELETDTEIVPAPMSVERSGFEFSAV